MAHSPTSNVQLEQGQEYQAQIQLNKLQALGSNSDVKVKFEELGFTRVTVSGDGQLRQAKGTWSQPTTTIEKPSQVVYVIKAIKTLG